MKLIITFISLVSLVNPQTLHFTNPIIGSYSVNPSILKLGEHYYLTLQSYSGKELKVYKSQILTSFLNVESKVVFKAPDGFTRVSINEMFEINGELYMYFHMQDPSIGSRRLYVMKADNPSDPLGKWGDPIRLLLDWDYHVVDGTVLKHNNNSQLYFVWTNVATDYSIYIAPMISPTLVGNPKVKLRQPQEAWECKENFGCHVAGSSILYGKSASYLIYSAYPWSSPDYCLGQMSIIKGSDPLILDNWEFHNKPVFWKSNAEDVYGTGVAEFTQSPDGTETWMIYHAAVSPFHVGERQTARLERIEWNDDGSPRFPRPHGIDWVTPVPSGQMLACAYVPAKGCNLKPWIVLIWSSLLLHT